MQTPYDEIMHLIDGGQVAEARRKVDEALGRNPQDARLHCLAGRICMKNTDWQGAINAFLRAESIDPGCPAAMLRHGIEEILAFYCKDYYNP